MRALKFSAPLGLLAGTLSGAVYWLALSVFPSSVAVILSMAANAPLIPGLTLVVLFYVLIKYSVLMALTAAHLPYAAPAGLTLPLIMIGGYGASYALAVSMAAVRPHDESLKISSSSLSLTLLIGLAPAAVLGIPGLTGLVAAILATLGWMGYLKFRRVAASRHTLHMVQCFTELSFYLGALSVWRYV